jgi:two-component system sensor histidine kinase DesK
MRNDDRVSGARFVPIRAGQLLGLLFLAGPISDLARGSGSQARVTAIVAALIAFVLLYLVLLPPVQALVRRGDGAIRAGLLLLAATAALTLALGAPRSFALLFVYVVAAASLLQPLRVAGAVTGITAVAVAIGLSVAGSPGSTVASYTLTILAIGAMMAALGKATRTNRELTEAREELARLAVSDERVRIARDLHDLLGHTLSVIALKSDLAIRLLHHDLRRSEAEMTDVQRVTRQALTEVRDAVQGYRRLAIADALDGARAALSTAGVECRVHRATDELPADVETVLAWALREATTNVVRHSGARACAITLSSDRESATLQVDDDGPGTGRGDGDGTGLAGLAERARRLHGTLQAGAKPDHGFRMRLTLPLRATCSAS